MIKNKKKMHRSKHIWFSVWNPRNVQLAPKSDEGSKPVRHSNR